MLTPEPAADEQLARLASDLSTYLAAPCHERKCVVETLMANYLVSAASPTAVSVATAVKRCPDRFAESAVVSRVMKRGKRRRLK
jgi:hypothetical protein